MTNTIAAVLVSLVTNVSETFPHMTVVDSPPKGQEYSLVLYTRTVPVPNPTEKWITTSIVEVASFTIDYGVLGPVKATKERSLTNWTTRYTLVPPAEPKWLAATNNSPIPGFWPMGGGLR